MPLLYLLLAGCRSEMPPSPTAPPVDEAPVMKPFSISADQITARNSSFGDADVDRLLADPALSTVRMLDLTGAHLSAVALDRLLSDPRLAELKTLYLGSSTIGDAGLLAIAQSPAAPHLETLHVPRVEATPAGIAAFAEQARFAAISLSIGHQAVGDVGAIGLAACTGITTLDLESAQVGTVGAVALLSQTSAASLSLRDNPIHLDGLQAFSPALTSISFKMTMLTEADLVRLSSAAAPALQELNFEQVPITDGGLAAIREAGWLGQLQALSIGAPATSAAARRAFLAVWGVDRWISIQRRDL